MNSTGLDLLTETIAERGLLPVTIIAGFLGSGKTTLINHILHNNQQRKIAVLVNEFGDINIDSQLLISSQDEKVIELSNGCICCTINDNLAQTIYEILDRPHPIDYLIIETTGLAEPLPVALTFLATELRSMTQLDSILTVIDSEQFDLESQDLSTLMINQIAYSDIILLNKTDLVSAKRLAQVSNDIKTIKSYTKIIQSEFGRVPLPLIMGINLADVESLERLESELDRAPTSEDFVKRFNTVSFKSNRPLSLKKFQEFLDYQLPENVLRAKGILWFAESPARHIFQLSGRRFSIDDSDWLTSPSNQLVFIGEKLDRLRLQQLLNNCLTSIN